MSDLPWDGWPAKGPGVLRLIDDAADTLLTAVAYGLLDVGEDADPQACRETCADAIDVAIMRVIARERDRRERA